MFIVLKLMSYCRRRLFLMKNCRNMIVSLKKVVVLLNLGGFLQQNGKNSMLLGLHIKANQKWKDLSKIDLLMHFSYS